MNRASHWSGGFLVVFLSLGCALPLGAGVVHVPDANSVALHHLDETIAGGAPGGKDFVDASGNGRHGIGYNIAAGQITMGAAGVTGGADYAVDLAGGDTLRSAIVCGSVLGSYTGGSFTFEGWIRNPYLTGAEGTTGRLIAANRSTDFAWSLGLLSNGALRLFGNNAPGSFAYSSASLGWGADTWYYVAVVADTADQSLGQARFTLYRRPLGGALTPLVSFVTNAPVNSASSDAHTLGGETSASARSFNGRMDEVHFSNVARDYDYVESHSRADTVDEAYAYRVHKPDGNSVVLLHLEETAANLELGGTDFADGSGRGHHGHGYDIATTLLIAQNGIAGTRGVKMANTNDTRNKIVCAGVYTEHTGGSFTVEAWIRNPAGLSTADADYGRIIANCRGTPIAWCLGLNADGGIRLRSNNPSPNDFDWSGPALSWAADTWYYVALVADTAGQAAGQAEYAFYRGTEGEALVKECSAVLNESLVTSSSGDFGVGGETSAGTRNFRGEIDEVHFSNVARTYDYLSYHFIGPPVGTLITIR